jgi:uncharacterized Zn finger protein (UPF0148 family)
MTGITIKGAVMKIKKCKHIGESLFMTVEKHCCPICGKIYYVDHAPINFKIVTNGGIPNELPIKKGV